MSREEVRAYSTDGEVKPPSVLVVGNDPLIVALITGLLISENYSVTKSYSGQHALRIVQAQHIDLIICDVAMPSMNGTEFLTLLRKEPEGAQIPVVLLTSAVAIEDRKAKYEHGVEQCVPKPLDPHNLLCAVRASMRRKALAEMHTKRDFDAYRKRVVHTLSHEFRTPLSAINVGIELLMEHRQSLDCASATNVLEAVRRGGVRLERLVRDFLILQQMEAGITKEVFASHASAVSVAEIVERYMNFKAPLHGEEGASFSVHVDAGAAHVHAVESNILDCLDRLVSNAVKFSEREKHVEIAVTVQEREARFAVKDRGCGIDRAKVDTVFELFSQIDRNMKEQQGGGMGLAIALRYARAHNGRLEITTREGGGTIVTLVLPVIDVANVIKIDPLMREQ